MTSVILGIDPGVAITGYGVVRENDSRALECVAYGVIRTEAGTPLPERLLLLFRGLKDVAARYQPTSSAVEELFFQTNVKTAISVAQGRGAALLALAESGLNVAEYTPLQVKQAVTGYGKAAKDQMQQMVKILLNLPEIPHPDDAADALAVAICHLHSSSGIPWG